MMRRLWNVEECSTFLFWIEGGGGSVEQEWGRTNNPKIEKSRMALGTAWVHLREARARGAYGAQAGGAGPLGVRRSTSPSRKQVKPTSRFDGRRADQS